MFLFGIPLNTMHLLHLLLLQIGIGNGSDAIIVQPRVAVTIVDDDDNGMISFELPSVEVGSDDFSFSN